MEDITCVTPSWEDMVDYAKKTSNLIKSSGFRPDVVIALSRGGLVPARLFCDFLMLKNCYSIKIDHWGLTATKDGKAKLHQGFNMDLKGKKVLIVDDITDTGQSLELARNHINDFNPDEIKTATLIHLTNSEYTPDFYGEEREWAWIIFPWNFMEDIVNLTKKLLDENPDLNRTEIKTSLKEKHKIDVPESKIGEVIDQIEYLDGK